MTGPPRMSGEEFALERLREDPESDFTSVRNAGEQYGITVLPIHYGRARRQLGLTGPAPTGERPTGERTQTTDTTTARVPATPSSSPVRDDTNQADTHEDDDVERAGEPHDDGEDSGDNDVGEDNDVGGSDHADEPADAASAPKRRNRDGSPSFEFLVAELQKDGTLSYGELKALADAAGMNIAPIMYGRAKALLGLVPVRPRGQGKNRKPRGGGESGPSADLPPRTAPRSLQQVESVAASRFSRQLEEARTMEQLMAAVKELDAERRRLRALLEQIADTIDAALGYDEA